MQAMWPMLTFYLSVAVALGVGALALVTGNSPSGAVVKAGAALLTFGTLGWALNLILVIAATRPRVLSSLPKSDDDTDSHEDSSAIDQTSESDESMSLQDDSEQAA